MKIVQEIIKHLQPPVAKYVKLIWFGGGGGGVGRRAQWVGLFLRTAKGNDNYN